jgi:hypothetical protein
MDRDSVVPNPRFAVITCLLSGLIACSAIPPARAAKPDFNGAWSVEWCDKENPERECGAFNLYLVQDGDRLCGEHQMATVGLGRLDEGQPGSVLGSVSGNRATVVIDATRSGAKYMATAERMGNRLQWRIVGMVLAGESDEPTILPRKDTLTRDLRASQVEHAKAVKDAPCKWPDGAAW